MKRIERHKSIGRSISAIYRAVSSFATDELREYEVKGYHIPYIMLIAHLDEPSQDDLARELMVDKATVTRTVARLVELGLVARARRKSDARAYTLSLTEKGERLLPRFVTSASGWFDVMLSGLSEGEQEQLERMLQIIVRKIQELRGTDEKD